MWIQRPPSTRIIFRFRDYHNLFRLQVLHDGNIHLSPRCIRVNRSYRRYKIVPELLCGEDNTAHITFQVIRRHTIVNN